MMKKETIDLKCLEEDEKLKYEIAEELGLRQSNGIRMEIIVIQRNRQNWWLDYEAKKGRKAKERK